MTTVPKITAAEAAPFACRVGIKNFCLSSGLDYATFLREGFSVDELRATGDVIAVGIVDKILIQREAQSDGQ